MMMDSALKTALDMAGGPRKVAKAFKISRQAVLQWKRCPVVHARKLSQLSGVPLSVLRPDVWPADLLRPSTADLPF